MLDSNLIRYLSGKKYILFFHIMHLGRYLFMFGCIHMVFKKAIGFWGNKKMFEVTDIRKYNHTMSKLYVAHGIVFILPGLPLLAGHCCGSCSGNHCFNGSLFVGD